MELDQSISYEERERERTRLRELAEVMTTDELRIAIARLADNVKKSDAGDDDHVKAFLRFRGQVATEILEAREGRRFRFRRTRRILNYTMDASPSEDLIRRFCRIK